jgi:hypothetical protein
MTGNITQKSNFMSYKIARELFHLMKIGETKEITRDTRDALIVYLSRMRKKQQDLPSFVTKKIDNNGRYQVRRDS